MRAAIVTGALLAAALMATPAAALTATPAPTPTPAAAPAAGGSNAVTAFGTAAAVAAPLLPPTAASVVGVAASPDGGGYWLVTAAGQVFGAGDATPSTSAPPTTLAAPIIGIAAGAGGYWLAGADGGVFAYGDAPFLGSAVGVTAPIVGIAATPDAGGYWLVTSDGRVFSFGDAGYHGGASGLGLGGSVVGMAATPDGHGYWLVSAAGGVYAFGDAGFAGSLAGRPLAAPIIGIAAGAGGYWLVGSDGGVFAFGDAPFLGAAGASPGATAGIAGRPGGYWVVTGHNPFGPAMAAYVGSRADDVTAAVFDIATGETFTFRPGVIEHTASTVKLDILATLLQDAQAAGRPLTPTEQSEAVPMIEESLDSAADALWVEVGPAAVARLEDDAGLVSTTPATDGVWGTTTTTALDRLAMVRAVEAPNQVLSDASRAYILNLMEHVTPSQDWGATGGVPADVSVALKNGFAPIGAGWQINTEGWVNGDGRDYLIAVLTAGNPSEVYGIQTVDQISSLVWDAMG